MERSPLFVVIEPSGAAARAPATRIAWACESGAGVSEALPEAARAIVALGERHPLFLADPLFDAPRLEAALAAAGLALAAEPRDWLLALAPFGQARNLAAILAVAAGRADLDNPASHLLEAWKEARDRAAKAQPKR